MKTAPPGISIYASSIPSAGLGAFADVSIPAHTIVGEYEGDIDVLRKRGLYAFKV